MVRPAGNFFTAASSLILRRVIPVAGSTIPSPVVVSAFKMSVTEACRLTASHHRPRARDVRCSHGRTTECRVAAARHRRINRRAWRQQFERRATVAVRRDLVALGRGTDADGTRHAGGRADPARRAIVPRRDHGGNSDIAQQIDCRFVGRERRVAGAAVPAVAKTQVHGGDVELRSQCVDAIEPGENVRVVGTDAGAWAGIAEVCRMDDGEDLDGDEGRVLRHAGQRAVVSGGNAGDVRAMVAARDRRRTRAPRIDCRSVARQDTSTRRSRRSRSSNTPRTRPCRQGRDAICRRRYRARRWTIPFRMPRGSKPLARRSTARSWSATDVGVRRPERSPRRGLTRAARASARRPRSRRRAGVGGA